jgi:hypothetical protein
MWRFPLKTSQVLRRFGAGQRSGLIVSVFTQSRIVTKDISFKFQVNSITAPSQRNEHPATRREARVSGTPTHRERIRTTAPRHDADTSSSCEHTARTAALLPAVELPWTCADSLEGRMCRAGLDGDEPAVHVRSGECHDRAPLFQASRIHTDCMLPTQ